ncbi:MAG: baseplate J/gp47 family protein [Eubacterium sp.]|nr:baseplate J/gp47 family protein [Eubacterium sp.]
MLPVPELDNQEYDEILDMAINTVVSRFPEWTDFNAHDPGITMLELFATIKESEQYMIDQISRENRIKFLKLMGIKRRVKRPARTLVFMRTDTPCELMQGHKLDAGGIHFETVGENFLSTYDIHMCIAMRGDEVLDQIAHGQMEFGGKDFFNCFGADPQEGDICYIGFDKQPLFGDPMRIYLLVDNDYPVRRNPLFVRKGLRWNSAEKSYDEIPGKNEGDEMDFASPVSLRWEYHTVHGWEPLEILQDQTCGMLFDGFLSLKQLEPSAPVTVGGQEGYYIRAVLERGGYEVPPVMNGLSVNICEAVQRDTLVEYEVFPASDRVYMNTELSVLGRSEVYLERDGLWYPADEMEKGLLETTGKTYYSINDGKLQDSDRVLVINRDMSFLHRTRIGDGSGFPNQRIDLEDYEVMEEPFAILVHEIDSEDAYRLWTRVSDFENSGPEDHHFVIDSENGVLKFGDCIHGMAPEGEIRLAAYARTKGVGGNVRKGKINRFVSELLPSIEVSNILDGTGGFDEETLDESFLRAKRRIMQSECAVTAQDYERYVRHTPGLMIENCQVLYPDEVRASERHVDENTIYMVVQPYGYRPGSPINVCYENNITAWLERFRMLGSPIHIFFPEFIEVEVYADLMVKPQYRQVEERVREAVTEYFDGLKGQFGKPVILSRLYGFIDRQDFVLGIRSLTMDAKGHAIRRTHEGDIILPAQGTVVLTGVRTFLTVG